MEITFRVYDSNGDFIAILETNADKEMVEELFEETKSIHETKEILKNKGFKVKVIQGDFAIIL